MLMGDQSQLFAYDDASLKVNGLIPTQRAWSFFEGNYLFHGVGV